MTSNIMFTTQLDENQVQLGLSKEITSAIQKLKKNSGVQIEDEIEIFYSFSLEGSQLKEVVGELGD